MIVPVPLSKKRKGMRMCMVMFGDAVIDATTGRKTQTDKLVKRTTRRTEIHRMK